MGMIKVLWFLSLITFFNLLFANDELIIAHSESMTTFYCNENFNADGLIDDSKKVMWLNFIELKETDFTSLENYKLAIQDLHIKLPLKSELFVINHGFRITELNEVELNNCEVIKDNKNNELKVSERKASDIASLLIYLNVQYGYILSYEYADYLHVLKNKGASEWFTKRNYWLTLLQNKGPLVAKYTLHDYKQFFVNNERANNTSENFINNLGYVLNNGGEIDFDKYDNEIGREFLKIINDQFSKDEIDWELIIEFYQLNLVTSEINYLRTPSWDSIGKMLALSILVDNDEITKKLAKDISNRFEYLGLKESSYGVEYDGFIYNLSEIINQDAWGQSKYNYSKEFLNLFEIDDFNENEFDFYKASEYMSNELMGSNSPGFRLFQVELLAYEKLLKKYKGIKIKNKPILFTADWMNIPIEDFEKLREISSEFLSEVENFESKYPIHQSIMRDDFNKLENLLIHTKDVETLDEQKNDILSVSVIYNRIEMAKYILDERKDFFNKQWRFNDNKALKLAIKSNRLEFVKLFIKSGIDLAERKTSLLELALDDRAQINVEVIQTLINNDVKSNDESKLNELELALENIKVFKDSIYILELLESKGGNLEKINPLCLYDVTRNKQKFDYFISRGVSIEGDGERMSPIECAILNNEHNAVKWLIELGLNTDIEIEGESLVDYASYQSSMNVVRVLENANGRSKAQIVNVKRTLIGLILILFLLFLIYRKNLIRK